MGMLEGLSWLLAAVEEECWVRVRWGIMSPVLVASCYQVHCTALPALQHCRCRCRSALAIRWKKYSIFSPYLFDLPTLNQVHIFDYLCLYLQYATEKERLIRYSNFINNLKAIEEHNLDYMISSSYTKGINQFSDLTCKLYLVLRYPLIFATWDLWTYI